MEVLVVEPLSSFTVVLRFSFRESVEPVVCVLCPLCLSSGSGMKGQGHHCVPVTQTLLLSFHILSTLGEYRCRD